MHFIADASNNTNNLCLVVYHIPAGFVPKIKNMAMLKKTHLFIQPGPARNRGLKSNVKLRDQKTLSLLFQQKLVVCF